MGDERERGRERERSAGSTRMRISARKHRPYIAHSAREQRKLHATTFLTPRSALLVFTVDALPPSSAHLALRSVHAPLCARAVLCVFCALQIRSQAQNHKLKKKEYSERYRREARKADFGTRPGQEAVEITDDDRY